MAVPARAVQMIQETTEEADMGATLDGRQKEQLRLRLLERAVALRREIGAALRQGDDAASGLPNRYQELDDAALADLEEAVEIAGVDRDARELAAVDDALTRLAEPEFGLCAGCGAPIGWERLLACPHAVRCTRCESAREPPRAQPKM